MQLIKKWVIFIFIIIIPVFGQENKKESKPKSFKKKNKIEFSNNQNTQDYLDMLEKAFYQVRESYVDSVNESEIIKSGIKGMMKPLDPYTRFLSGSSKNRLDMLRTGKYGVVGIAQKIMDGNQRANETAIMTILNHIGLLKNEEKNQLIDYEKKKIFNHKNIHIGLIEGVLN